MLIVCIGALRSGSTFQYNLVSELVERTGGGQRQGFFQHDELFAFKQDLIRWGRDGRLHVVKVHDWDWELETEIGATRIKYVSCFRDPVEVATSARRKFSYSLETTISALDSAFRLLDRLESDERALIQSYISLTKDTRVCAEDLANHLDLRADRDVIDAVLEQSSVKSTSEKIDARTASPRAKMIRFLRRIGVTRQVSRLMRAVRVPDVVYFRLRRASAEFDTRSLYHPDHISGSSQTFLTPEEIETIRSRYAGGRWTREQ